MAQYIFDFLGTGSFTFTTLADVLNVLIAVYAGLYAFKIVMGFISSVIPNSKNSVFRGL